MKLEELKNCMIRTSDVRCCLQTDVGVQFVDVWHLNDYFPPDQALLAAARFRASEEMYQALKAAIPYLKHYIKNHDFIGIVQAEAALALADNTNETL